MPDIRLEALRLLDQMVVHIPVPTRTHWQAGRDLEAPSLTRRTSSSGCVLGIGGGHHGESGGLRVGAPNLQTTTQAVSTSSLQQRWAKRDNYISLVPFQRLFAVPGSGGRPNAVLQVSGTAIATKKWVTASGDSVPVAT